MNRFTSPWSTEDVALLIRLVDEGFSASMISACLGHRYSRNAVIGKATRLGKSLKGIRVKEVSALRLAHGLPSEAKRFKEPPAPKEAPAPIGELNVMPLFDGHHESGCCYVTGEVTKLLPCGHKTARNKRGKMTPYCEFHQGVVYQRNNATQSNNTGPIQVSV